MATMTSKPAQQAGKAVLAEAKHKAGSPWVERLERFGFLIRGLVYIVIGCLALQLAVGAGGATTNPTGAIELIGRQPFGKPLLVVIAVGLAGYSLWGFVRAILDPLGRGSDTKGLIDRAGFLASGIGYGVLSIATVQALLGKPGGAVQGGSTGVPATLTTGPAGKWLVIAVGVVWIVAGAAQLASAYRTRFMRDLRTSTMSAEEIKTATWLGRAGYGARGFVFGLIGLITLQAVLTTGARQPQSFDGALAALAHAPYGEILLGAVAIGLILFGVFSVLCAKWNKIGSRSRA
jgi:hypothetical protein